MVATNLLPSLDEHFCIRNDRRVGFASGVPRRILELFLHGRAARQALLAYIDPVADLLPLFV